MKLRSRNPQRRTHSTHLNIELTPRVAKMSLVSAVQATKGLERKCLAQFQVYFETGVKGSASDVQGLQVSLQTASRVYLLEPRIDECLMEVTAALHRQHRWNLADELWSTLELYNTERIAHVPNTVFAKMVSTCENIVDVDFDERHVSDLVQGVDIVCAAAHALLSEPSYAGGNRVSQLLDAARALMKLLI